MGPRRVVQRLMARQKAVRHQGAERIGIELTHVYGLTEVYGPASVCSKHEVWEAMPIDRRAERNGRQGVRTPLQDAMTVLDPETMAPVPWDGETMGEIVFRGNIAMKGYLKNRAATDKAFAGGWFWTGDLAVRDAGGAGRRGIEGPQVVVADTEVQGQPAERPLILREDTSQHADVRPELRGRRHLRDRDRHAATQRVLHGRVVRLTSRPAPAVRRIYV